MIDMVTIWSHDPVLQRAYWPSLFSQDGRILAKSFVCVFMDWAKGEVHKHAEKEWGHYPAILTEQAWPIKDLFSASLRFCYRSFHGRDLHILFVLGVTIGLEVQARNGLNNNFVLTSRLTWVTVGTWSVIFATYIMFKPEQGRKQGKQLADFRRI